MRRSIALGAVAVLTFAASQAFADSKYHHGTFCSALTNQFHYSMAEGFIATSTSGTDEATCPIIRDTTGDTNGASDIEMSLVDGGSGTAYCTAYSMSRTGSVLDSSSRSRSSTGKLDWGSSINVSVAHSSSTPGSSYAIVCDLPGWWWITNYYANE